MLGRRLEDLGTKSLSWRDLYVIAMQSPPTSALVRAIQPERAAWAAGLVTADLLALVADLLAVANWQRQGKRNAQRPKPITRPGDKPSASSWGAEPIPIRDFDSWWENPQGG